MHRAVACIKDAKIRTELVGKKGHDPAAVPGDSDARMPCDFADTRFVPQDRDERSGVKIPRERTIECGQADKKPHAWPLPN
ncbi:MAG TPA: hypothetical protein VF472_22350 [Burkholderiaceae bacterium]